MNSGYFNVSEFFGEIPISKIIILAVILIAVIIAIILIIKIVKKRKRSKALSIQNLESSNTEQVESILTEQVIGNEINNSFNIEPSVQEMNQGYQAPVFEFNQNNIDYVNAASPNDFVQEPVIPANDFVQESVIPVNNFVQEPVENNLNEKPTSMWNRNINNN